MRKVVESTFVTLDGVVGSPETWGASYWDDEHAKYTNELFYAADSLLLGRATYDVFAEFWPKLDDPYSERINALPKYVASNTLTEATWNASVISGDVASAVADVKAQPGGDILKYGTGEFDRTLIEHQLIDEFHFWVHPVAVGAGVRLLDGLTTSLELVNTTRFASGVVVLTYTPR
jgi:dihydrofolate reductase